MKHRLLATLACIGSLAWASESAPLWLRHQSISPDGKTIAFCYKGDIYSVSSSGGRAQRLTSNAAYDTAPVWSPDSKQIAFSSDREGTDDLYIMPAEGGTPKRLTVGSGSERPVAFVDNGIVLFQTYLMPDRQFDLYPSGMFAQTFAMPTTGGRPKLWNSIPMDGLSLSNSGEVLYTDVKGYEDYWRKHHTSSIARNIWHINKEGRYQKLTTFSGEDRNAIWDGQGGFYYLSEQDGTFNVYHRAQALPSAKDRQLTTFSGNPVRFLSRASDGTLCFGYDGQIYTMRDGSQPQLVNIDIVLDAEERAMIPHILRGNAISSFSVAPSGKEIAFVERGDVYVVNVEFGTTKRITNTAEQERSVDFAPDGRSIVYAGERGGQWQLFQSELVRKDDINFAYAKEIREKQLTQGTLPSFHPQFSPDGKEIAFLRNRTSIVVLNLKSGKERIVMPEHINYSYTDGDQDFVWSPNGKYIMTNYMGNGGWTHVDCAVYNADGSGLKVNLTQSGYNDGSGRWVLDGKAILFGSDRAGYRSHGSWGATQDLYLMFLDHKAYEDFIKTKEERAIDKELKEEADKLKKKEEEAKNKKKSKKAKDKKKTDDASTKPNAEISSLDLEQRERRTLRLTRASGAILDAAMNKEGTKVYYIARFESSIDLWEYDVVERTTKVLVPQANGGALEMAADGKTLFLASFNGLKKLDGTSLKPINITAEFEQKPMAEREHVFSHVWQQVLDKFYDPKLHGVDWQKYRSVYAKFVPHINNNRDFSEMLSEMLGELNASHTGARAMSAGTSRATGRLGAFFDGKYEGAGFLIEEIMPGSPLALAEGKVQEGMVIESIDGQEIEANRALAYYMQGKAGKKTLLGLRDLRTGKTSEVLVKPITFYHERELLYERWLKQRADLVDKWSNSRVAYVYVRQMNSPSFRTVFKDLMGKYRNREAVIVDTRYNGGGWLHEDLAILLSGRKYLTFNPRGQYIGDDPFMQWSKPSCVLMSEGNYSNGHGFPWVYKELGIGKLIGAPVPGTMTAVWWERMFNNSLVFGVPQVTCQDLQGRALENMELQPDIEVYNSPEDYLTGQDTQLKRAVEEMLKVIDAKK